MLATSEHAPLHLAAAAGGRGAVAALVECGASLSVRGERSGKTPLHCACERGRLAVARALLGAGQRRSARARHRTVAEEGRLAQEYGAVRIDPLPDSWVDMDQPWARLHPSNGRIVEMQAIEGKMRVPDQAIESGRLKGEVRIRIFEPQLDGQDVPLDQRKPSVVIEAEEADYDAAAGEIHSPRVVRVSTSEASLGC